MAMCNLRYDTIYDIQAFYVCSKADGYNIAATVVAQCATVAQWCLTGEHSLSCARPTADG